MKYNPSKIEKKWQEKWKEKDLFHTEDGSTCSKPKYYVLDMFPYPSGSGLHVGHVVGYTATDIMARHKRKEGFNVLHPMGWDSFGLAAEQYAVRTGTHPAITTKINTDTFRRQLQALGFSYDWKREFATSEPKYFKWTQWIFTKLFEKGLAYEAEMQVNYCPALGTVLANEEVENGKAKEGGHLIERRPLRQWVLKITEYADRLIEDLDLIDWPESLKKLQINWIGKSQGAEIAFDIENTSSKMKVFTTRPDTLFGVTYVVLAPEHPLLKEIVPPSKKEEVAAYQKKVSSKSDLDRTDLNKEKSGVFTGAYAVHPITQEKIPVWTSDYVLMGYGTGAVMAVPAHDERDFEFATTFSLPIQPVILPKDKEEAEAVLHFKKAWEGEGVLIHSQSPLLSLDGLSLEEAKEKAIEFLEKEKKGKRTITYKLRDWLFSRQRYWGEPFPILHFENGDKRVLELDELPLLAPEIEDYQPSGTGQSPLAKVKEWVEITDSKTGLPAKRETNTMPQWAGSCWYYLRFCDPLNTKEAWSHENENYFLPVDLYVGGVEHAVLHLLYARFWHKVLYDLNLVSTKEPFQKLRNQGLVVARSYQKANGVYVASEEVEEKEGEFFHKKTQEKLLSLVEKMSKSKLNGISPDQVIEEFGADALRLYTMFMGPIDKEKVWNTEAVSGVFRLLSRFYDLIHSPKVTEEDTVEGLKLAHRLLNKCQKDILDMQFNTAISTMMEFMNDFVKLDKYPKNALKMSLHALSPFAPHLAEELWETLGEKECLSNALYPEIDPSLLQDETSLFVVQVNGKVRGRVELSKEATEEELLAFAKKDPHIQAYLEGKEIKKVIFVKEKLLSLVV